MKMLTNEEIKRIGEGNTGSWQDDLQFARAIESAVLAKLKAQEPVAWLITVEKQDGSKETYPAMGRFKDVKASCDFGEPIPLYVHPDPRVAELEAVLRECLVFLGHCWRDVQMNDYSFEILEKTIAKIDEVLK